MKDLHIKNRINDVDFVKGIMIFLMVCFHINVGLLSTFTAWVYSFHMPIFLLYTGFFVSMSKPLTTRVKLLVRSLIIPYFLFESTYVLLLFMVGQMGFKFSNNIDLIDFSVIFNYLILSPIGAYWYLHTVIISLIIIYFVEYLKVKNLMTKVIIIGLLFFITSMVIDGIKFENEIFIVLGYFFKVFGYTIYASAISIVGLLFIYFLGDTQRASVSSLGTTFFMISFLKFVYNKCKNTLIVNLFIFLGKNTLIIVLLHPIFLNVFKISENFFMGIDSTLILYSVLNTLFTLLFSILAAYIFDKINFSNLLFGKQIYIPYSSNR